MTRLSSAVLCVLLVWTVPTRLVADKRLHREDDLRIARCEARCHDHNNHYGGCVESCLNSVLPKLGTCPEGKRSLLDSPCMTSCSSDSQCPGIDLCCRHNCGALCVLPYGLKTLQTLPDVPTEVSVYRRRSKNITVQWWNKLKCAVDTFHDQTVHGPHPSQRIIYVLQERHHTGPKFVESRLGEWQTRKRTKRNLVIFTRDSLIRSGRWYQFRVAAVNENGTRGFSEPTTPFKTPKPRPARMPLELRAGPPSWSRNSNGLLTVPFSWRAPRGSDLPIDKYKVYWSRRLPGVKSELDSVLVSTLIVPQDETSVQLTDISPNSQYFLQVQALSQYGDIKIKGEKASMILNTTFNPIDNKTVIFERNEMNLKVKYYHKHGKLYPSIVWSTRNDGKRTEYIVKLTKRNCNNEENTETYSVLNTTTKTAFELLGLSYHCQYLVQVTDCFDNTTARMLLGRQLAAKRRKTIH